jgi:hypothetical protein
LILCKFESSLGIKYNNLTYNIKMVISCLLLDIEVRKTQILYEYWLMALKWIFISLILFSIQQGTTTSISFVKVSLISISIREQNELYYHCKLTNWRTILQDELFPYIRRKLESHLKNNWDSQEVQNDIESLRKQVWLSIY